MSVDPRVQRLLKMLAAGSSKPAHQSTLEERRAALDSLMRLGYQSIAEVITEEGSIAGPAAALPVRCYRPATVRHELAGLIYFHGGGLTTGSIDSHDGIARALARDCACPVISVGYRLAPEHPFPAALDDAMAAIPQLAAGAAFGQPIKQLGIVGDSAGAAIAAAACQRLASQAPGLVSLQLLLCPILDYTLPTGSKREFARGFLLQEETWQQDLKIALPIGLAAQDPSVSPLRAVLPASLPRTLIHTAEYDPMRDEGRLYAEALRRHGVEVSYTCHPGMIHLFYGLGALLPQANTAFGLIGDEVRAAFEAT